MSQDNLIRVSNKWLIHLAAKNKWTSKIIRTFKNLLLKNHRLSICKTITMKKWKIQHNMSYKGKKMNCIRNLKMIC
jgi:hypothetical protein